ncbi:COX15/CtaA family protein [Pseudochelatococcus lubricantis]|uniref:COX15/CtaA family protein n=1 Tax=Pseudochelatococcus lubricantis TaxID=1538102 RepID=UPI0035E8CBF0
MTISTFPPSVAVAEKMADPARRSVRIWLGMVAALIVLMVIVGGATRLTGSGLSITEWRPVTGMLLPLTETSWLAEFEKYRATPQYQLLNHGMTLGEFQFIYLWEWGHRQLGRLIGFIYLLPLLWFAYRGVVRGRFLATLLAIGLLGGAQGGIGWIMVASGLEPGMTAVAPIKLMLHLVAACGLFVAVVWIAVGLRDRHARIAVPARLRITGSIAVAAILVQIALGALVAGLNAGMSFNTWPLMAERLIPDSFTLLQVSPWWRNLVESTALVQFNHRVGAYLLLALVVWHAIDAARAAPGSKTVRMARVLAGLVLAQAAIGIMTLLLFAPLWAALLHQAMAVLLLGHAVAHRRMMSPARVFPVQPASA